MTRVRKLPVAADPSTDPIPVFVRAARKATGMSGVEFGLVFGFTKGAVSHWEKGTNTPDYGVLVKMSTMSGVPLPEMLPAADTGFGAGAMKLLRDRLGAAQRRLPKALLASIQVPSERLVELAEFMVMLEGLLERYPDAGSTR
jgi:transcriptional regulator with XRE-family HTH domain